MIVEATIVLIFILYYYWYGISYSIGSAEYAKNNNNGTREAEDCWASVCDEFAELVQAVKELNAKDIFLEYFDVMHSFIKYLLVTYLPQKVYYHWLCWFIVFPFVLPASIKLGNRYNRFRCIRNHDRININHKCIINSKKELEKKSKV